jgi:acyl transferase domain-containing protein
MTNVVAPEDVVLRTVAAQGGELSIVARNAPQEWIVSGPVEAIDRAIAHLEAQGIRAAKINFGGAAHSPQVDPILDAFEEEVAKLTFRSAPTAGIEVVSTLTGTVAGPGDLSSASYWRRQLRGSVRAYEALSELYERGHSIFLEVAPNAALTYSARTTGAARGKESALCASTLRKKRSNWEHLASVLAALHVRGVPVDWAAFDRHYPRDRRDLPLYPFERQRYWLDDTPEIGRRATTEQASAAGTRLRSPAIREAVYEQEVAGSPLVFEDEHTVCGKALAPAGAYVALIEAAARDALGVERVRLEDVSFLEVLDTRTRRTVQTILRNADRRGERRFQVCSRDASGGHGAWVVHVEGSLRGGSTESSLPSFDGPPPVPATSGTELYARLEEAGYRRGPRGRLVTTLWTRAREAVAVLEPVAGEPPSDAEVLEAALEVMLAIVPAPTPGEVFVPIGIGRVDVQGDLATARWVRILNAQIDGSGVVCSGDVQITSAAGELVAAVGGYTLKRIARDVLTSRGRETELRTRRET